jgi:hypothetical protein
VISAVIEHKMNSAYAYYIMGILSFIFGEKSRLKVVQDHDFIEYLKRIGLLEEVQSRKRFCYSCGTVITIDNLQAITPADNKKVHFICDKKSCLRQVYK